MIRLIVTLLLFSLFNHFAYAQCRDIDKKQVAEVLNAPHLSDIVSIEAADCASIQLAENTLSSFLNADTQKIYNGVRAEVVVNYPFNEGDQVTYQLEVKFPEVFQADDKENNRWWLIAQWHDQPNKNIGETWKNFPSLSPPIAIYVESRDGVPGMGLIMFGKNKLSWNPIPLEKWLTLNITMRWSSQDDGIVDFSVKQYPEFQVNVTGKNMNNAYQHYLKFGQYRHPNIKLSSQVMFKNLAISH